VIPYHPGGEFAAANPAVYYWLDDDLFEALGLFLVNNGAVVSQIPDIIGAVGGLHLGTPSLSQGSAQLRGQKALFSDSASLYASSSSGNK